MIRESEQYAAVNPTRRAEAINMLYVQHIFC